MGLLFLFWGADFRFVSFAIGIVRSLMFLFSFFSCFSVSWSFLFPLVSFAVDFPLVDVSFLFLFLFLLSWFLFLVDVSFSSLYFLMLLPASFSLLLMLPLFLGFLVLVSC